jgi:hypothetical protein
VEDQACQVYEALDFGDAPDKPFPTLAASTGAVHAIAAGIHLGARVDGELDGQPNGTSTGDDIAPPWLPDDEDGIVLPPAFGVGAVQSVHAVASVPGVLSSWIDWTGDGDWNDPAETLPPQTLAPGPNTFPVAVPPFAVPGGVHSRFRFTASGVALPYTGFCPDGEVEDYEVLIVRADFGDAPDGPYPTLLVNSGAWHAVWSNRPVFLGARVDNEIDGLPSVGADGDDLAGVDDEDGVTVIAPLVRGRTGVVAVVSSTSANLYVWADLDRDGTWDGPGENLVSGLAVAPGSNLLSIPVPPTLPVGPMPTRFRITTASPLGVRGYAPDGEVEDHVAYVLQPAPPGNPVLTNMQAGGTAVRFEWSAVSNTVYQPQSATNLTDAPQSWVNLGGQVTGPTNAAADTSAVETVKFYRVVVPYIP